MKKEREKKNGQNEMMQEKREKQIVK